MSNADRMEKIKAKLKRRALPLAFLIGFVASVIAVDPFSGVRGPASEPIAASDPFANPLPEPTQVSNEPVELPEQSNVTANSSSQPASDVIGSIGGIDGVSEVGSAHPFDRAYPRPEQETEAETEAVASSKMTASRKPANVEVWESGDSLQNLKFDDNEPLWSGKAQLLPNPMFVEQLNSKRMKAIRGGGWMAIDLARGEIWPVELFKSTSVNFTSRAVIEAKVVRVAQDGHGRVLNTVNTGIPVVRGIPGVVSGSYEVPETPGCLARYAVVTKEEVCSAPRPRSAGGAQIRFRFEPPVASAAVSEDGSTDPLSEDGDFQFTTVYVETVPGRWLEIGTFNESFTPIGDANRDGYPDFYLESLSETSSGGRHDLLISSPQGEGVVYTTYSARFIGQ